MSLWKNRSTLAVALVAATGFLGGCLDSMRGALGSPCSAIGGCKAGSTGASGNGGSLSPQAPKKSPFKLTLKSYWDSDTGKTNPTDWASSLKLVATGTEATLSTEDCVIPEGTLPAPYVSQTQTVPPNVASERFAVNDHAGVRVCAVEIPETQLYFSSLEFTVETPANHQCDVVYFDPYYYLFSRSLKAQPPWLNAPIDCATLNGGFPAKGCYSGPATEFFTNFPFINTEANSIQNKAPVFKKSWTINPAFKSLNGAFTYGNRWTSFQPDRLGSPEIPSNFDVNDHRANASVVAQPHDWRFMCVKTGSNLNYRYIVRIIPIKDNPYYGFVYPKIGWHDDNGNDAGQAPEFIFTPNRGPIDGGTKLTFQRADNLALIPLSPSSAVILGNLIDGDGFYAQSAKYLCEYDAKDRSFCKTPQIDLVDSGLKNVYFSNVASKVRKAKPPTNSTFTYDLLDTTGIGPPNGPMAGGTTVTISGQGIAKDATIKIGGVACAVQDVDVDWANDGTSIKCKTGASTAAGVVDVEVKNPTTKQVDKLVGGFTYN